MVLGPQGPGRVGRCQAQWKLLQLRSSFFCVFLKGTIEGMGLKLIVKCIQDTKAGGQ